MDINQLIGVYVKMRDKRSALKRAFDKEYNTIGDQMDVLSAHLLKHCKDNDIKTVSSDAGRATRSIKTRYWAGDWEEFANFAKENDALNLYEKRIAQAAMAEFLKDNPDIKPPINSDSKYVITVTRAPKK